MTAVFTAACCAVLAFAFLAGSTAAHLMGVSW